MEPSRLKAAAMASYLRSAITGSSSSARAGGDAPALSPDDASAAHDSGVEIGAAGEVGREEDAQASPPLTLCDDSDGNASVCRTESDRRRQDSPRELQREAAEKVEEESKQYSVTYEPSPDDDDDYGQHGSDKFAYDECADGCDHIASRGSSSDEASGTKKLQLQFVDVLFQADAHGLGLNIQVAQRHPLSCSRSPPPLVVASFRRLHPRDVGPAEATRQIRPGDILHAVDGEVVLDLQHLHSIVQQKRARSDDASSDAAAATSFVLLRLLRPMSSLNESDSASTSSLTTEGEDEQLVEAKPSSALTQPPGAFVSMLENKQQVAMTIRELVARNQELQQELVTSRVKLAEQAIQLEQLYALYARTQLDNATSAFVFSKSLRPFARRGSNASVAKSEQTGVVSPLGVAKRAGSSSSSRLHSEIEFAVRAEQERLRKHYELQMDLEKRQAAVRHQQELQALREMMEKKLEMLDTGFQEVLRQQQESQASESMETCSCGTWMRLQQELFIHQSLDHDDEEDTAECLVCCLLTDARRASTYNPNEVVAESSTSTRMQRVMEALHEYALLKQKRTKGLGESDLADAARGNQRERDDPLQP